MKRTRIFPLFLAFFLVTTYVSAQVVPVKGKETKAKYKTQNVKMKVKGDLSAIPLPYPVQYSSQFIPGNPANSKMVLDIWKDIDNNTIDRDADAFVDTVAVYIPDVSMISGRQQLIDVLKTYRSSLSSLQSTIDAVMSMRSIDKEEDWVLIWGSITETTPGGQSKTIPLHEAWRINLYGKVDLILQYTRPLPKM